MKTTFAMARIGLVAYGVFVLSVSAPAMDRWTALCLIESGGRHGAVGQACEISRYQIRAELWPGGNPLNASIALINAQHIMSSRACTFERTFGRDPNDYEFYILWNAPAQINHPHPIVVARARRFLKLLAYN